ncbi:MAG: hypothetical protein U9R14_03090 [Patescibacteria group bacterium]|nr:hypothetical protein [Patescibacteria group bacterium]
MLSYLQKFNKLPKQLRNKVSAPEVMAAIEELEKRYKVDLAAIVMRIMIKDLMISDLAKYFASEFRMKDVQADQLAAELKEKIFVGVTDYLEIKGAHGSASAVSAQKKENLISRAKKTSRVPMESSTEKRANFFFSMEDEQEIGELSKKIDGYINTESFNNQIRERLDKIIKQTQINFGSEQLVNRFKQILRTYFRGIRDRIEAKQTLVKPFEAGGLNFDRESAEKVLLIADGNFNDLGKADEIKSSVSGISRIKIPESDKRKLGDLEDSRLASPVSDRLTLSRLTQVAAKRAQDKPNQDWGLSGIRDIDYDLAKEFKKIKDSGKPNKLDTKHKLAPPPPSFRHNSERAKASIAKAMSRPQKISPFFSYDQSHKAPSTKSQQTSHLPTIKKNVEIKSIQSISADRKAPPALNKLSARDRKDFSNKVSHNYGLASRHSQTKQANASPTVRPAVRERRGGEIGDKVKMEDVKYVPKIVSPIDELKYMSLINFRRLEQDLNKIIIKIKQKIDLLEEENYAQRLAGIKAWRVSPVNRLYLEMGQTSINSSKPIDAVIEERKIKGQEYLNSQEFKAVMDLNRDLRF